MEQSRPHHKEQVTRAATRSERLRTVRTPKQAQSRGLKKRPVDSARQRELERIRKQKEREAARKARQQEREQERAHKQAERETRRQAREQARLAARAERERQKQEARRLKQEERARKQAEREALRQAREQERLNTQAERERQREENRRLKEEDRARREAEREAYRKAKEAERERLRAEREAARRALEGKVALATRQSHRADGFRASTARLYRAESIPDQSGTTRRTPEGRPGLAGTPNPPSMTAQSSSQSGATPATTMTACLATAGGPEHIASEPAPHGSEKPEPGLSGASESGLEPVGSAGPRVDLSPAPGAQAQPTPVPSSSVLTSRLESLTIEEREARIQERLARTDEEFRHNYLESLDMSWIYHDSALEGVVYTFRELKTAIDPNVTVVPDSSLQPVCEEIRRHKAAIDLVRELALRKKEPITVDTIKRLYLILHPEEGDLKSVKYRKDIPQHRLYFHEYAPPDKIAYKVRQVVDWLNGPEPKKIKNPIRIAARAHYDLLRVFPFPTDSGKVARLLMNLVLLRSGYPPAIIHSTERQRYYEALKGALPVIVSMVSEAIHNGLLSIEKRLDEQETRMRSFVS